MVKQPMKTEEVSVCKADWMGALTEHADEEGSPFCSVCKA